MKTWNIKYNVVIDFRQEFVDFLNGIKSVTFWQYLINRDIKYRIECLKSVQENLDDGVIDYYTIFNIKLLSELKFKIDVNCITIDLDCDIETTDDYELSDLKELCSIGDLFKYGFSYYLMLDDKCDERVLIVNNFLKQIVYLSNTNITEI